MTGYDHNINPGQLFPEVAKRFADQALDTITIDGSDRNPARHDDRKPGM